jgi:transcription-repair coupling factor (superfamily II helicase)
LRELQVEMIDRFGLLPEPVKNLFRVTELKLIAAPMGVTKIEAGRQEGRILFGPEAAIDTRKLVELLQCQPGRYRFEGGNKLRFSGDFEQEEKRFAMVAELLSTLARDDETQDEQTTRNA